MLRQKLSDAYPQYVDPEPRCWMATRAGGVLGKISFLYLSFTEYLIILGCPARTNGFSGRYNFMEIYEFVLSGKVTTCDLETDQISPSIYLPGDYSLLEKGHAATIEIDSGSWMLEYGRGPNITAMPFGLMDTLISNVDSKPLRMTAAEYIRFVIRDVNAPPAKASGFGLRLEAGSIGHSADCCRYTT